MSEMRSNIYINLHVKYPLFLSDINENKSSKQIFEKFSNINFMPKCSMRTDGQDEAIVAFCQIFQNAPKERQCHGIQYNIVKSACNFCTLF